MATAKTTEDFTFPDEGHDPVKGEVDMTIKVDDGLEVEIVDDTPPKDKGRQPLKKPVDDPTDAELDTYTTGVKQRIKDLTHARHDSRREAESAARERDEAITFARQAIAENEALRRQFAQGAQAFGQVAVQGAEAKVASAKQALKAAQEAFDTEAIVNAQEKLADAVAELREAKNFRAPPVQTPQPDVQTRQPQPQAQPRVHPKTQEWQANNPWYGAKGFEEYTSYALGLHKRLVEQEGLTSGSDAYFDAINSRLRKVFPELFSEEDDQPATEQKKPPVVAAPATRQPPSSSSAAVGGKVRLTKSQAAVAAKLGITPKQYAQQLMKLQQGE